MIDIQNIQFFHCISMRQDFNHDQRQRHQPVHRRNDNYHKYLTCRGTQQYGSVSSRTLRSAAVVDSPGTVAARATISQRTGARAWEVRPQHSPRHRSDPSTSTFNLFAGWERHYSGLSDSDLTTHSLENRIRPRHSLSPDKDFMGDFGDSDMESVVSVTSSAFSTQSERPRGSKGIR